MYQSGVVNQTLAFSPWSGSGGMGGPASAAIIASTSTAQIFNATEELRTSPATCCSGQSYGRWCQDTANVTPGSDTGARPAS